MKESAAATRPPLMEGLRNLTTGYDRKFALSYCADDVWAALEALERIDGLLADPAGHPLDAINFARAEIKAVLR